jgi:hypothetical protein
MTALPALDNWQDTKSTLHAYSKVVGAIPRAHGLFHPKWWHISLKMSAQGLTSDPVPLPSGGLLQIRMDLSDHRIKAATSDGALKQYDMRAGRTADDLASELFSDMKAFGLEGEYATEKFENADPRSYDSEQAANYWSAMTRIYSVLQAHRATIDGVVGPLQLWPHGFDLAFEWFGTRTVTYKEHGEVAEYPSQLNLGFSPGEPSHPAPYFYSNPFPFEEDVLLTTPLPEPAFWFTDGWQGSLLEYSSLVGNKQGSQILGNYAKSVYDIAYPTLMA